MPLKPQDKRPLVRVAGKIHPDLADRFSRYLIYLNGSDADYVIAGALERTMDGDNNFRKWERDPNNKLPVATGKSNEAVEQKNENRSEAGSTTKGVRKQKPNDGANVTGIETAKEAAA